MDLHLFFRKKGLRSLAAFWALEMDLYIEKQLLPEPVIEVKSGLVSFNLSKTFSKNGNFLITIGSRSFFAIWRYWRKVF